MAAVQKYKITTTKISTKSTKADVKRQYSNTDKQIFAPYVYHSYDLKLSNVFMSTIITIITMELFIYYKNADVQCMLLVLRKFEPDL